MPLMAGAGDERICVYEGTSADKVREQAERTGMPADEVALVAD